jgi:hypothetical protein
MARQRPGRRGALALVADVTNEDADEARAAEQWLHGARLAFLLCRGAHSFPKPREKAGQLVLPKGYRVRREATGVYEVTETCPDCGTIRTYEAGSPDVFGPYGSRGQRRYHYQWPEGYLQPKGAANHISTADCKSEAWRWISTELDKLAVPE